jgi:hypothetical protein
MSSLVSQPNLPIILQAKVQFLAASEVSMEEHFSIQTTDDASTLTNLLLASVGALARIQAPIQVQATQIVKVARQPRMNGIDLLPSATGSDSTRWNGRSTPDTGRTTLLLPASPMAPIAAMPASAREYR